MKTVTPKHSSLRTPTALVAIGTVLILMGISAPASARDYDDRHEYRENTRHYQSRHYSPPPPRYGHNYGHSYVHNQHYRADYRPVYYTKPHNYKAPHYKAYHYAPAPVYSRDYYHSNGVDIYFRQHY